MIRDLHVKAGRNLLALVAVLAMLLCTVPVRAAETGDVPLTEEYFPNEAFRNDVAEQGDLDSDGVLSPEEIAAFTELYSYMHGEGCPTLQGVEYLTELETLFAFDNALTEVDLSRNTRLTSLDLGSTNLEAIRLKNNKLLQYLWVNSSRLQSLDLTANTALKEVYAYDCRLSSIKAAGLKSLNYLDVERNQLKSIDLTGNTALEVLYISNNQLTQLDIHNNSNLRQVYCYGNQIKLLDISGCPDLINTYLNGTRREGTGENGVPFWLYVGADGNHLLGVDKTTTVRVTSVTCTGLNLEETNQGVGLSWEFVTVGTEYEISRKAGGGDWTILKTSADNTYTDRDVLMGEAYRYRLRFFANGVWSDYVEASISAYNPFKDVSTDASYFKALSWAFNHGIISGSTETTFSPNDNCNRGQFASMLWRLAGKPSTEGLTVPFEDVPEDNAFRSGIAWCYSKRIVAGTTPTTYSPAKTINRWQLIVMLWRMAGKPKSSLTSNPYTDISPKAAYYKAALWAYQNRITSVKTFNPNTDTRRWQVVVFLYKMNLIYHYLQ